MVQVWVHPHVKGDKIFWEADSDSALTKVRSQQSSLCLLPRLSCTRCIGLVACGRVPIRVNPIHKSISVLV